MIFVECSLFIVAIVIPCLTLLLLLLVQCCLFYTPCSILLVQCCLFGIPCSMLLVRHCCCSYCSLLDVACLVLLAWRSLLMLLLFLLFLVWCYLFNAPCWRYYCFYYSLFEVAIVLGAPLMMLLLLLLLVRWCSSSCCSFYCCYLLNIVDFSFIRLEHNLFKYLFATPWCWCSLLDIVAPTSPILD